MLVLEPDQEFVCRPPQATYAGLPDFLTRVVEDELGRIPRAFARGHPEQRWTIVYLPQVRILW